MAIFGIQDRVGQLWEFLQARSSEQDARHGSGHSNGHGGSGNQQDIRGTNGDDLLDYAGETDNLEIDGKKGDDTILSGAGDDEIDGGKGDDSIDGGAGDDEIDGGKGDDTIFGGAGEDEIDGGKGDDEIDGGSGDDEVDGGSGDDTILGGDGEDTLDGGKDDDLVSGGAGDDEIDGGKGDDTLSGGEGDDTIDGGKGDDVVTYEGSILDYAITATSSNDDDDDHGHNSEWTITDLNTADGDQGTDVVSDAEVIQFDDYTLYLDGTNNGPMVVAADQTTDEDTATSFSASVFDFEGDAISIDNVTFTGAGTFNLTTTALSPMMGSGVQLNFSFDPDGNYETLGVGESQVETVTIEVSDGNGGTETVTFNVTVTGVNDAPVAVNDVASTDEDVAVNITVLTNDSDIENDNLTVITAVAASGAVVVINADNTLSYTPNDDFFGTDTITYTIDDGNGGQDTATVTVTVNSVNDAPVAGDDVATTDQGTEVDITVLTNDSDIENDPLTVITAVAASGAVVVINADNTLSYTPVDGFFGTDTITYTIDDGNGGQDTATVTVTVNQAGPEALDDVAETTEDMRTVITVLDNDVDLQGGGLTVISAVAANGLAEINVGGSLDYLPNQNFFGVDTITYIVEDINGVQSTATVTVTVNAVNDAPDALDPAALGEARNEADGTATVDLLGRTSDVEGDTVTITSAFFIDPTTGLPMAVDLTLVNGIASFDPADFGLDSGESMTVQISFIMQDDSGLANDTSRGLVDVVINGADDPAPVNTAPTANSVTLIADEADGDISVSLNGLVSDPDEGDTLTIISLTADYSGGTGVPVPFTGGVVVGEGGTLVFDPTMFGLENGDQETITLTYTVQDAGGLTSTNTITLELTGDTPGVPGNIAPTAASIITVPGEAPNVDPFSGGVIPSEVTVGDTGAAPLVVDLTGLFADPDGDNSLLVVTVGDLVIGIDENTGLPITVPVTFDPLTNQITIPVDETFLLADGESAIGTLEYTVSDGIDTTTAQITFNYTNPEPVIPVPVSAVLDFEIFDVQNGISVDVSGDAYEGITFSGHAVVLNPDEAGGGRNPGGILTGQTTTGGENVLIGNITTIEVPVLDGNGDPVIDPVTRLPMVTTVVDEPFGIFGPGSAFDFEETSVDLGFVSGTPFLPNGFTEGDAFNLDGLSLNIPSGSTLITITTYTIDVTLTPIAPGSAFNNGVMDVVIVDTFQFIADGSNGAAVLDFNSGTFIDPNNGTAITFDPSMFDGIDGLTIEAADGSPIVLDDILITY